MDTDKLEKANILHRDLQKIQTWIGDLKHINRHDESPYNPNKILKVALWKKLFTSTRLKATKENIEIDPQGVRATYINVWDITNEELSLELGYSRARMIDFMIGELSRLEKLATDKFKNA